MKERQAGSECPQGKHIAVLTASTLECYRVGLGVAQIVQYFKTSQNLRVIVPLNGHFKSELW